MRNLEKGAYITVVIGTFLDQLSTRLALTSPWIYEANSYSRYLMDLDLWLPFDIFVVWTMITGCILILRKWKFVNKRYILFTPYLYGSLRTLAGIWNFYLYLKVV